MKCLFCGKKRQQIKIDNMRENKATPDQLWWEAPRWGSWRCRSSHSSLPPLFRGSAGCETNKQVNFTYSMSSNSQSINLSGKGESICSIYCNNLITMVNVANNIVGVLTCVNSVLVILSVFTVFVCWCFMIMIQYLICCLLKLNSVDQADKVSTYLHTHKHTSTRLRWLRCSWMGAP